MDDYIIAVDPGMNPKNPGAIVGFDGRKVVFAHSWQNLKKTYEVVEKSFTKYGKPCLCIIEDVHGDGRWKTSSTAKLMQNKGQWEGMMAAMGIDIKRIYAQVTWKTFEHKFPNIKSPKERVNLFLKNKPYLKYPQKTKNQGIRDALAICVVWFGMRYELKKMIKE